MRKRKPEKRKAHLEEFDPMAMTGRKGPPQFTLHKEVTHLRLRGYRAVVPYEHRLEGDALQFLSEMRSSIEVMLYDELVHQHGIKHILVLTDELEKMALSTAAVSITTAYFRNEATLVLNKEYICCGVQAVIALIP